MNKKLSKFLVVGSAVLAVSFGVNLLMSPGQASFAPLSEIKEPKIEAKKSIYESVLFEHIPASKDFAKGDRINVEYDGVIIGKVVQHEHTRETFSSLTLEESKKIFTELKILGKNSDLELQNPALDTISPVVNIVVGTLVNRLTQEDKVDIGKLIEDSKKQLTLNLNKQIQSQLETKDLVKNNLVFTPNKNQIIINMNQIRESKFPEKEFKTNVSFTSKLG